MGIESNQEREQEIQEVFAMCKTFDDFRRLVNEYDTVIGYAEAFERIKCAQDAYRLAWAAQEIGDESFMTKALDKFLDLVYIDEDENNNLHHCLGRGGYQFFYEIIFSDANLIRKAAGILGVGLE